MTMTALREIKIKSRLVTLNLLDTMIVPLWLVVLHEKKKEVKRNYEQYKEDLRYFVFSITNHLETMR